MKTVKITRNARLKKDDDGMFWLLVETSAGSAMFNLTAIGSDESTEQTKQIGSNDVLEAVMREQETPTVESPN